ncbi:hypothetical protein, partial [Streptacidiphilus neutrinimicus]|uniref:hypothetical protein n=1 Tax=Streptacidiphilus neutrinimicus TaxID=105420 RepID=UPI00137804BF
RRVVLDFGATEIGPAAVGAVLRIDHDCRARDIPCTIVAEDRALLTRALADNLATPHQGPALATDLAAALRP